MRHTSITPELSRIAKKLALWRRNCSYYAVEVAQGYARNYLAAEPSARAIHTTPAEPLPGSHLQP